MCLSNVCVSMSAQVRKMVDDMFYLSHCQIGTALNQALEDASRKWPLKGLHTVNVTLRWSESDICLVLPHGEMQIRPAFYYVVNNLRCRPPVSSISPDVPWFNVTSVQKIQPSLQGSNVSPDLGKYRPSLANKQNPDAENWGRPRSSSVFQTFHCQG